MLQPRIKNISCMLFKNFKVVFVFLLIFLLLSSFSSSLLRSSSSSPLLLLVEAVEQCTNQGGTIKFTPADGSKFALGGITPTSIQNVENCHIVLKNVEVVALHISDMDGGSITIDGLTCTDPSNSQKFCIQFGKLSNLDFIDIKGVSQNVATQTGSSNFYHDLIFHSGDILNLQGKYSVGSVSMKHTMISATGGHIYSIINFKGEIAKISGGMFIDNSKLVVKSTDATGTGDVAARNLYFAKNVDEVSEIKFTNLDSTFTVTTNSNAIILVNVHFGEFLLFSSTTKPFSFLSQNNKMNVLEATSSAASVQIFETRCDQQFLGEEKNLLSSSFYENNNINNNEANFLFDKNKMIIDKAKAGTLNNYLVIIAARIWHGIHGNINKFAFSDNEQYLHYDPVKQEPKRNTDPSVQIDQVLLELRASSTNVSEISATGTKMFGEQLLVPLSTASADAVIFNFYGSMRNFKVISIQDSVVNVNQQMTQTNPYGRVTLLMSREELLVDVDVREMRRKFSNNNNINSISKVSGGALVLKNNNIITKYAGTVSASPSSSNVAKSAAAIIEGGSNLELIQFSDISISSSLMSRSDVVNVPSSTDPINRLKYIHVMMFQSASRLENISQILFDGCEATNLDLQATTNTFVSLFFADGDGKAHLQNISLFIVRNSKIQGKLENVKVADVEDKSCHTDTAIVAFKAPVTNCGVFLVESSIIDISYGRGILESQIMNFFREAPIQHSQAVVVRNCHLTLTPILSTNNNAHYHFIQLLAIQGYRSGNFYSSSSSTTTTTSSNNNISLTDSTVTAPHLSSNTGLISMFGLNVRCQFNDIAPPRYCENFPSIFVHNVRVQVNKLEMGVSNNQAVLILVSQIEGNLQKFLPNSKIIISSTSFVINNVNIPTTGYSVNFACFRLYHTNFANTEHPALNGGSNLLSTFAITDSILSTSSTTIDCISRFVVADFDRRINDFSGSLVLRNLTTKVVSHSSSNCVPIAGRSHCVLDIYVAQFLKLTNLYGGFFASGLSLLVENLFNDAEKLRLGIQTILFRQVVYNIHPSFSVDHSCLRLINIRKKQQNDNFAVVMFYRGFLNSTQLTMYNSSLRIEIDKSSVANNFRNTYYAYVLKSSEQFSNLSFVNVSHVNVYTDHVGVGDIRKGGAGEVKVLSFGEWVFNITEFYFHHCYAWSSQVVTGTAGDVVVVAMDFSDEFSNVSLIDARNITIESPRLDGIDSASWAIILFPFAANFTKIVVDDCHLRVEYMSSVLGLLRYLSIVKFQKTSRGIFGIQITNSDLEFYGTVKCRQFAVPGILLFSLDTSVVGPIIIQNCFILMSPRADSSSSSSVFIAAQQYISLYLFFSPESSRNPDDPTISDVPLAIYSDIIIRNCSIKVLTQIKTIQMIATVCAISFRCPTKFNGRLIIENVHIEHRKITLEKNQMYINILNSWGAVVPSVSAIVLFCDKLTAPGYTFDGSIVSMEDTSYSTFVERINALIFNKNFNNNNKNNILNTLKKSDYEKSLIRVSDCTLIAGPTEEESFSGYVQLLVSIVHLGSYAKNIPPSSSQQSNNNNNNFILLERSSLSTTMISREQTCLAAALSLKLRVENFYRNIIVKDVVVRASMSSVQGNSTVAGFLGALPYSSVKYFPTPQLFLNQVEINNVSIFVTKLESASENSGTAAAVVIASPRMSQDSFVMKQVRVIDGFSSSSSDQNNNQNNNNNNKNTFICSPQNCALLSFGENNFASNTFTIQDSSSLDGATKASVVSAFESSWIQNSNITFSLDGIDLKSGNQIYTRRTDISSLSPEEEKVFFNTNRPANPRNSTWIFGCSKNWPTDAIRKHLRYRAMNTAKIQFSCPISYTRTKLPTTTISHELSLSRTVSPPPPPPPPYISPLRKVASVETATTVFMALSSAAGAGAGALAVGRSRDTMVWIGKIGDDNCGSGSPSSSSETYDTEPHVAEAPFQIKINKFYAPGTFLGNFTFIVCVSMIVALFHIVFAWFKEKKRLEKERLDRYWNADENDNENENENDNNSRRRSSSSSSTRNNNSSSSRRRRNNDDNNNNNEISLNIKETLIESNLGTIIFYWILLLLQPMLAGAVTSALASSKAISMALRIFVILLAIVVTISICYVLYKLLWVRTEVEYFALKHTTAATSTTASNNNNNNTNNNDHDNNNGGLMQVLMIWWHYLMDACGEWEIDTRRRSERGSGSSRRRETERGTSTRNNSSSQNNTAVSKSDSNEFKLCLPLLEPYRDSFKRFVLIDLSVIAFTIFAEILGNSIPGRKGCIAVAIFLLLGFGLHFFLTIKYKPNVERLMQVAIPVVDVLCFFSILIPLAIPISEDSLGGLMVTVSSLQLVITSFAFLAVCLSFLGPFLKPLWLKFRKSSSSSENENERNRNERNRNNNSMSNRRATSNSNSSRNSRRRNISSFDEMNENENENDQSMVAVSMEERLLGFSRPTPTTSSRSSSSNRNNNNTSSSRKFPLQPDQISSQLYANTRQSSATPASSRNDSSRRFSPVASSSTFDDDFLLPRHHHHNNRSSAQSSNSNRNRGERNQYRSSSNSGGGRSFVDDRDFDSYRQQPSLPSLPSSRRDTHYNRQRNDRQQRNIVRDDGQQQQQRSSSSSRQHRSSSPSSSSSRNYNRNESAVAASASSSSSSFLRERKNSQYQENSENSSSSRNITRSSSNNSRSRPSSSPASNLSPQRKKASAEDVKQQQQYSSSSRSSRTSRK